MLQLSHLLHSGFVYSTVSHSSDVKLFAAEIFHPYIQTQWKYSSPGHGIKTGITFPKTAVPTGVRTVLAGSENSASEKTEEAFNPLEEFIQALLPSLQSRVVGLALTLGGCRGRGLGQTGGSGSL